MEKHVQLSLSTTMENKIILLEALFPVQCKCKELPQSCNVPKIVNSCNYSKIAVIIVINKTPKL